MEEAGIGRKVAVLVLVLLAPLCHSQWCPTVPSDCLCDSKKGEDNIGGWEISCFDPETFTNTYIISYSIRKLVRVTCHTASPYKSAMFQDYNITDIDHFQFVSCPLPNTSFADILQGMDARILKFESHLENITVTADTFANLTSLEHLNLLRNSLTNVPGDLFIHLLSLKSVQLNDNELVSLPENIFQNLSNLTSIQLGKNKLESLPETVFRNLTKMQHLYLYKNKLKELPETIFQDLQNLKTIDISENRLQNVSEKLFAMTLSLTHINLRANDIRELPVDMFSATGQLEELDISFNPNIQELPEQLLKGLNDLRNVSINDCNATTIPKGFFSHVKNLLTINMWNNRLTNIPPELFGQNENLENLDLCFNDLTSLQKNAFANNYRLKKLKLCKNDLKVIANGVFDTLRDLKTLNLAFNFLTEIDGEMFHNLQQLEVLDLSKNQITEMKSNTPFGGSSVLREINLSHNNITEIPNINWSIYLALKSLDLKYNKIKRLKIPFLYSTGSRVYLQNNEIQNIDISEMQQYDFVQKFGEKKPERIDSPPAFFCANNPIVCDCRMFQFVSYVAPSHEQLYHSATFPDIQSIKCSEPPNLRTQKVVKIASEEFVCKIMKECPNNCSCFLREVDGVTVTNCSSRGLSTFPLMTPTNTSELHLENNSIEDLRPLGYPVWRNLTVVYLDNNQIASDEWTLPKKLHVISLSNNRLTWLPKSIMNLFKTGQNKELHLGKNLWTCDCSALNFKTWLTENSVNITDLNDMYCSEPQWHNGTLGQALIYQLTDDELCPVDNWVKNTQLITVTVVCVILAILLFILSVLYYRNKQTVIAYVYIHLHNVFVCFFSEQDLDEDKVYDAFVSYSSADRDIAMELMTRLEQGEPQFKLCIHERDWLPGNLISWNIVNSVQNSRRTILVLSKDFLESMWFQVEFHTAYYQMLEDRIDRLIIIVRGDLPEKKSLDKDLQFLLSTKTYLEWEERWFWEKLRYALPHKIVNNPMPILQLGMQPRKKMLRTAEDKIASLTNEEYSQRNSPKPAVPIMNGSSRTNGVSPTKPPRKSERTRATTTSI